MSSTRAAHDRLIAELQIWVGRAKDYQEWMIMDPDSGQIIAATNTSEEGKFRDDQAFFINGKADLMCRMFITRPRHKAS